MKLCRAIVMVTCTLSCALAAAPTIGGNADGRGLAQLTVSRISLGMAGRGATVESFAIQNEWLAGPYLVVRGIATFEDGSRATCQYRVIQSPDMPAQPDDRELAESIRCRLL
jgi:hypothetical protein